MARPAHPSPSPGVQRTRTMSAIAAAAASPTSPSLRTPRLTPAASGRMRRGCRQRPVSPASAVAAGPRNRLAKASLDVELGFHRVDDELAPDVFDPASE